MTTDSTPPGVISPILTNLYLHEVLEEWLHERSCRDLPAAQSSSVMLMTVRHDGAERRP